jgi:hypothetical protein
MVDSAQARSTRASDIEQGQGLLHVRRYPLSLGTTPELLVVGDSGTRDLGTRKAGIHRSSSHLRTIAPTDWQKVI